MEERNPYAAPKAPLFTDSRPMVLPAEADVMEFGGFWRRFGATILDALILSPMAIALMIGLGYTHRAHLFYALPGIVVVLWFHVYLVQRFGGTPGKRILGMRITMTDGNPVTPKAAWVRYAPMLAFNTVSTLASVIMSLNVGDSGFEDLSYFEKMQSLNAHAPAWNAPLVWIMQAWWIIGAITLAANSRKRAVHDFMAGTVVIRDG